MTDYDYDVFISYHRGGPVQQWVDQWFEQFLTTYLAFELDDEPRVFRDAHDLRTGDKWRSVLVTALGRTKCLVPIYTPTYFRSAWCSAEWSCFLERERATQRDLIVPVQWHSSDKFPAEAKLSQLADFREFALVGPAFRNTEGFLLFERRMKEFCRDLARKVENAPPRDPAWNVRLPEQDIVLRPAIRRPVFRDEREHV